MSLDSLSGLSLVLVDAVTEEDEDRSIRQRLQHNLQEWKRSGVSPLWINSLRGSRDIRLVCLVQDFHKFNTMMLDEIRSVSGVLETRAIFGVDGSANLDLLLDLEMEVLPTAENSFCFLYLGVAPGADRLVLENIRELPTEEDVRLVWALNTYDNQAGDLCLLTLSADSGFDPAAMEHRIRALDGVQGTALEEIVEWNWMADPEAIITLCEMFFPSSDVTDLLEDDLLDFPED